MRHATTLLIAAVVLAWGCKGDTESQEGSAGGSGSTTLTTEGSATLTAGETAPTTSNTGAETSGGSATTGSGTSVADATSTTSATSDAGSQDGTAAESSGEDTDAASSAADSLASDASGEFIGVSCGGTIYACGDETDNDGDGMMDLLDPECTGPCDDDEGTFATGIPGDNMDCRQDCFFDGNSGQGDDGCDWNLRCDMENPGAEIGCEYTGAGNCSGQNATQTDGCIDVCTPFTPPGCDCFGCCLVDTPTGERTIFLNSGAGCALDNLDACQSCTQSDDCMNDCEPEQCERCFGDEELPEECDGIDQMCDSGTTCDDSSDCPEHWFCLLGCCLPPVG